MTPTLYRNRWLKQLAKYEALSNKIVGSKFRALARDIPFNEMTPALYEDVIAVSISIPEIRDTFVEIYQTIGLVHGRKVGEGINASAKAFDRGEFENWFSKNIRTWIITYVTTTLVLSTRRNLIQYLTKYMFTQIQSGVPFEEAKVNLQKLVASRSFFDWQIARIARTESSSAANLGAHKAGEMSKVKLEKVWISARDSRTRRIPSGDIFDHWEMHERRVPEAGHFSVPRSTGGFENLLFPGDPNASIANRINCRCTFGFVPVRTDDGDLIFTDSRLRTPNRLAN